MNKERLNFGLEVIGANIKWKTNSTKERLEKILALPMADLDIKIRRLQRLRAMVTGYVSPFDNTGLFIEELRELRELDIEIYNTLQKVIKGEM